MFFYFLRKRKKQISCLETEWSMTYGPALKFRTSNVEKYSIFDIFGRNSQHIQFLSLRHYRLSLNDYMAF